MRWWIGLTVLMTGSMVMAAGEARDVSPLLRPIIAKYDLPGMAALVIEGDQPVLTAVAGVRKRGAPQRMQIDDQFHIGSCTKAMTATLCAMLVEEGKLSWTTTLKQTFPEVKQMNAAFGNVTLEQLLTHRGGVPGDTSGGIWPRVRSFSGSVVDARQYVLEQLVTKAPAQPIGDFAYSNAGYAIAGHMAERVSGRSWEQLIAARLFKPLGMTSAGFGAPGTRGRIDQPLGHRSDGKPVEPGPSADNPAALGPAGTVHCTITDWGKFVSLHLLGSQGQARLLKAETFQKLHTPADAGQSYAMGWGVHQRGWAGGTALSHAGSNTMWYAVVWAAPRKNFAVLICTNQGGDVAPKACDEAVGAMMQAYLAGRKP